MQRAKNTAPTSKAPERFFGGRTTFFSRYRRADAVTDRQVVKPLVSCGFQQQPRVPLSGGLAAILQHRLVAAELQIVGTFPCGDPHKGVEPTHGGAEHQKEFGPGVLPADVDQLMPQNHRQFLPGIAPLRQDHPNSPLKQPRGKRRRHIGGAHQLVFWLFEASPLQLLRPDGKDLRIGNRLRTAQNPPPEGQVGEELPQKYHPKANGPYLQQHPGKIFWSQDDQPRYGGSM